MYVLYIGLQEIMLARQEQARIGLKSHNSYLGQKPEQCTRHTCCTTATTTATGTCAVRGDKATTDDCCDCSCWQSSSSSSSHIPTHQLNTHTNNDNNSTSNNSNNDGDKCIYHPSIEVYSKLVHEYHLQLSLPPVVFKSLDELLVVVDGLGTC